MPDAKVEVQILGGGAVPTGGKGGKDPTGLLAPVQGMNDKLKGMIGPTAAIAGGIALLSNASSQFRSIFKRFVRLFMKLVKPIGDIMATLLAPFLKLITPIVLFINKVFRDIDKVLKFLFSWLGGQKERIEPGTQFAVTSLQATLPQFKPLQDSIDFSAGLIDEYGNNIKDFAETMDEVKEEVKKIFGDYGGVLEEAAKDALDLGGYFAILNSSIPFTIEWFNALNNIVSILTTGMTLLERAQENYRRAVLFGTQAEQQAAAKAAAQAGITHAQVFPGVGGPTQGVLPSGTVTGYTTEGFEEAKRAYETGTVEAHAKIVEKQKITPQKPKGILDFIGDVSTGVWKNITDNIQTTLDIFNPLKWFGFQEGGIVPGRGPVPILAHGGETILPEGVAPVNVSMNVSIAEGTDIDSIVDIVSTRLRDELTSRGV